MIWQFYLYNFQLKNKTKQLLSCSISFFLISHLWFIFCNIPSFVKAAYFSFVGSTLTVQDSFSISLFHPWFITEALLFLNQLVSQPSSTFLLKLSHCGFRWLWILLLLNSHVDFGIWVLKHSCGCWWQVKW